MASRPAMHQRTVSQESSSSSSSNGHRLILEHILSYPGTYELPLRTMYTLNLAPRAQPLPALPGSSASSSSGDSPTSPTFQFKHDTAAQQLTSSLMAEISQMPTHQNSLPPSFVTSFLRKCFAYELELVDFTQALTGLDYLKDLETRRCRAMKGALERLDINLDTVDSAEALLADRYPGVLEWYKSIDAKEHKINALYTQLYISLRRWMLLNELQLTPFSKHNCVAMLNTIYPPVVSSQPTPQLTPAILRQQRDAFFRYITAVEKKGVYLLKNLTEQGRRPDEENGWPAVRETLEKYLVLANSMIDECSAISTADDPARLKELSDKRGGRKVDSGISLAESRKSSNASTTSDKAEQAVQQRPPITRYKSTSTLEKIARELKNMTRGKPEIREIISEVPETTSMFANDQPKGIRKMKSFGSINFRRNLSSRSESVAPAFDAEQMKRQRLDYEAKVATVSAH